MHTRIGSLRRVTVFCGLAALVAGLMPPRAMAQETDSDAAPKPGRVSLVGTLPAELKVKRAKTGHLLVSPQIDGKDAGWFIFDTGAGMSCADKSVVQRLDLPDAGAASAEGQVGVEQTRLRKVKSLALGPILIEDSTVVELDLKPITLAMGEQIDGVIGYECFLAGVFEVDLDAGKIAVHDPATYQLPNGHEWQPLHFKGRRPRIAGRIEDKEEGLFLLDIGAKNSITVNSPAVKKFNLLDGRETSESMSGGVGGMLSARKGTLSSLTIGDRSFTDVPAVFSQAVKGAQASDDVQATIGVALLKEFLLIIHYKDRAIAMLPRPG